jgi:hypothetical protein
LKGDKFLSQRLELVAMCFPNMLNHKTKQLLSQIELLVDENGDLAEIMLIRILSIKDDIFRKYNKKQLFQMLQS